MDLKKPFKLNQYLFQLFGMWPPKGKFYTAYMGYTIVLHLFFTLIFILPMWIGIFLVDDLATMTQLSNMGLTELAMFTKMIIMFRNIEKVQELVESVNLSEFKAQSEWEIKIAEKSMRQLNKYMRVYIFSVSMGMVLGITAPMSAPVNVLPFYQWFFGYDWHKSDLRFKVLYAYQSVALSMHACLNTLMDLFLPFFFNFAVIQCDFIANRLVQLDDKQLKYRQELLKNVNHHLKVLKYCEESVEIFSFPTFIQFCLSGFIICFNAYQISIINPFENPFGMFYMCFYTCSMLQQIFYSCYYGNEIVLKFKDLGNHLYHSRWSENSVKYKHEFKFFLMKSNVVHYYKAWNSLAINLPTFMKIVQTSYSLYALLKNRN